MRRTAKDTIPKRRFGSEADVEAITGINRRTLQKHRLFGKGLPFYRLGGKVLYDLDEVDDIIRSSRVGVGGPGRAA